MINYDELVQRLREQYMDTKQMLPNVLCHDSADAITKLRAERDDAIRHLADWSSRCGRTEADLAAAQKECDDALAAVDANWVTHQQIVVLQQDLEAARALLRKAYIHVRYADTKPDAELERQIFDAALKDKP